MYGFEAASEFYFSKHAKDLTLTEAALLAGLPKGPAAYSPLLNPDKALRRRNLVLSEMESDGVITHAQAEQARKLAAWPSHCPAAERRSRPGFRKKSGRNSKSALAPSRCTKPACALTPRSTSTCSRPPTAPSPTAWPPTSAATDGRASWKMCSPQDDNPRGLSASRLGLRLIGPATTSTPSSPASCRSRFVARIGAPGQPNADVILLPADWQWTGQRHAEALVKPGDIIYVHLADAMEGSARRATLEQDSGAQGALMAIDNTSGDVLAMVGGRDFALSQFNRATQAERQTGSSFKPYVYTAAIEDGVKPDRHHRRLRR